MRKCDTHHTRSIKPNSAVNLSLIPGLDVCCDVVQHLQGVPRTCSKHFQFFLFVRYRTLILLAPSLELSFIWNVTRCIPRIIWMAAFAQYCLYYPSRYAGYIVCVCRMVTDRIVFVNRPVDPGSTQGSHRPKSVTRNKYSYRTRERPSIKLVELTINNHVGEVHKHYITNGI